MEDRYEALRVAVEKVRDDCRFSYKCAITTGTADGYSRGGVYAVIEGRLTAALDAPPAELAKCAVCDKQLITSELGRHICYPCMQEAAAMREEPLVPVRVVDDWLRRVMKSDRKAARALGAFNDALAPYRPASAPEPTMDSQQTIRDANLLVPGLLVDWDYGNGKRHIGVVDEPITVSRFSTIETNHSNKIGPVVRSLNDGNLMNVRTAGKSKIYDEYKAEFLKSHTPAPEPEPPVCPTCDGTGRCYNNNDPTSKQWVPCPDCAPEPPATAQEPVTVGHGDYLPDLIVGIRRVK